MEKTRILFVMLCGDLDKHFIGNTGFQWWFCKWPGIGNLAIQAAADSGAAEDFQQEFPSFISGYTLDQNL